MTHTPIPEKIENPFKNLEPINIEDEAYISEHLHTLDADIIGSTAYHLLEVNDFDYNAAADAVKETVMNLQVPPSQTFDEAEDLAE